MLLLEIVLLPLHSFYFDYIILHSEVSFIFYLFVLYAITIIMCYVSVSIGLRGDILLKDSVNVHKTVVVHGCLVDHSPLPFLALP